MTAIEKELNRRVANALGVEVNRRGKILYSATSTLSPGSMYLLGLNPGGIAGQPIASQLSAALGTGNAYLDEIWDRNGKPYEQGKAPLQKRIQGLIGSLGHELRGVCASNLVFMQSRDAGGINFQQDADTCWPVHEWILSIVRPQLIIAFGNSRASPYAYLRSKFPGVEETISFGHGTTRVKAFLTSDSGRPVNVVGLPHLSRFSPDGKEHVLNFLRSRLT